MERRFGEHVSQGPKPTKTISAQSASPPYFATAGGIGIWLDRHSNPAAITASASPAYSTRLRVDGRGRVWLRAGRMWRRCCICGGTFNGMGGSEARRWNAAVANFSGDSPQVHHAVRLEGERPFAMRGNRVMQPIRYHLAEYDFFVHANLVRDLPLEEQPDYHLFWEHLGGAVSPHISARRMICGHTGRYRACLWIWAMRSAPIRGPVGMAGSPL